MHFLWQAPHKVGLHNCGAPGRRCTITGVQVSMAAALPLSDPWPASICTTAGSRPRCRSLGAAGELTHALVCMCTCQRGQWLSMRSIQTSCCLTRDIGSAGCLLLMLPKTQTWRWHLQPQIDSRTALSTSAGLYVQQAPAAAIRAALQRLGSSRPTRFCPNCQCL